MMMITGRLQSRVTEQGPTTTPASPPPRGRGGERRGRGRGGVPLLVYVSVPSAASLRTALGANVGLGSAPGACDARPSACAVGSALAWARDVAAGGRPMTSLRARVACLCMTLW
eukprot:scaffold3296_cov405-Prasinococcus_capsulatus_cf.AAC.10